MPYNYNTDCYSPYWDEGEATPEGWKRLCDRAIVKETDICHLGGTHDLSSCFSADKYVGLTVKFAKRIGRDNLVIYRNKIKPTVINGFIIPQDYFVYIVGTEIEVGDFSLDLSKFPKGSFQLKDWEEQLEEGLIHCSPDKIMIRKKIKNERRNN